MTGRAVNPGETEKMRMSRISTAIHQLAFSSSDAYGPELKQEFTAMLVVLARQTGEELGEDQSTQSRARSAAGLIEDFLSPAQCSLAAARQFQTELAREPLILRQCVRPCSIMH